mgnify:CR=1 FL=1
MIFPFQENTMNFSKQTLLAAVAAGTFGLAGTAGAATILTGDGQANNATVLSTHGSNEAGTPNVIGDIRAALAFLVKDAVGAEVIAEREARFNRMALDGWGDNPRLTLLGTNHSHRLPIFSFLVRDAEGKPVHQQLFTRMLSDVYGIQARGGCACAGPYAHRLLDIDQTESEALHSDLLKGKELRKPGWVRLNFSYLMDEDTVQFIIDSVNKLSEQSGDYVHLYKVDAANARFSSRSQAA